MTLVSQCFVSSTVVLLLLTVDGAARQYAFEVAERAPAAADQLRVLADASIFQCARACDKVCNTFNF